MFLRIRIEQQSTQSTHLTALSIQYSCIHVSPIHSAAYIY